MANYFVAFAYILLGISLLILATHDREPELYVSPHENPCYEVDGVYQFGCQKAQDYGGNPAYPLTLYDADGDGSLWVPCLGDGIPITQCSEPSEAVYLDFAGDLNCILHGCNGIPFPNGGTINLQPGTFVAEEVINLSDLYGTHIRGSSIGDTMVLDGRYEWIKEK